MAASIFAILCGYGAAKGAILQMLAPLPSSPPFDLARYTYVLTHLAVGAGLLLGGTVTLAGLRRGSDRALLLGQMIGLASFCGMLSLEMWSLWAPSFST
jgi:hypothetical protein